MSDSTSGKLTSSILLARNTIFNILGQGLPLIAAVFSIPVLISRLGTDRFGVLSLAWMVISYFSFFDLGLGRALTKLVADKLGAGEEEEIPSLILTALSAMMVLGVTGSMVLTFTSRWVVYYLLKIPDAIQSETVLSFYLLAVSVPFVIGTTGLRGVFEAYQRFDLVNAVRVPMGIFTFLGPLMVLPFSNSLVPVILVLLIGRIIAWLVHLALYINLAGKAWRQAKFIGSLVKPLLKFGTWMTVTNIIGPLMVYMDRFFIGALISVTAVSYYTTPYEVVTKLWIIPWALIGVLFPAFAVTLAQDKQRAALLFERGTKYIYLSLFPITLLIVTFAPEGLNLWLGPEFVRGSVRVMQWLAVGVLINSLAQIPFALIQGAGRPDLTSKLHMVELPVYLVTLWLLIKSFGIEGAAVAWVLRVTLDTAILFVMARRFLIINLRLTHQIIVVLLGSLFALCVGPVLPNILSKISFLVLIITIFGAVVWFFLLAPEEKELFRKKLRF